MHAKIVGQMEAEAAVSAAVAEKLAAPAVSAPDPVFEDMMAQMGLQDPEALDPNTPSNEEIAALHSEAARGERAADIKDALHQRATLFPQARPRGGGIREGLVSEDARQEIIDPRFPDLVSKFFTPPTPLEKRHPDERVFQSRIERHYVQVTCPAETYDPIYGKRVSRKGVFFIFEPDGSGFGVFRTTDPFLITFIEGGEVERRNEHTGVLEKVQIPPMMGFGTQVWDAEERQKAEARLFVTNLKQMVAQNKQVLNVLRQETDAEDFAVLERLGARVDAKTGAR
jgi:hypothetical protein